MLIILHLTVLFFPKFFVSCLTLTTLKSIMAKVTYYSKEVTVLILIILPSHLKTRIKLLGIVLNYKLSFEDHINNICKKASKKLSVLAKIKKKNSQESICNIPIWILFGWFSLDDLVWIFNNRDFNKKYFLHKQHKVVNHLHFNTCIEKMNQFLSTIEINKF